MLEKFDGKLGFVRVSQQHVSLVRFDPVKNQVHQFAQHPQRVDLSRRRQGSTVKKPQVIVDLNELATGFSRPFVLNQFKVGRIVVGIEFQAQLITSAGEFSWVCQRIRSRNIRRIHELEMCTANLDFVSRPQDSPLNPFPVDESSIGTVQVGDEHIAADYRDFAMSSGNLVVVNDDRIGRGTSQAVRFSDQGKRFSFLRAARYEK